MKQRGFFGAWLTIAANNRSGFIFRFVCLRGTGRRANREGRSNKDESGSKPAHIHTFPVLSYISKTRRRRKPFFGFQPGN
jgi:hypothetical protein